MQDERLYWRGKFLWCKVRDRRGRIRRRATRCSDEAAASRVADEYERQSSDPVYGAAAETRFGVAVQAYLDDLVRRGRSAATKEIAVQKTGHMIRLWTKDLPLAKLGPELVVQYIDRRKSEDASNYTIVRELGHLRQVLKIARYRGQYHLDPGQVFPPYFTAGPRTRKRWLTLDEARALVAALSSERRAHVVFILATGARASEAVRARRRDIDLATGLVHIHGTKTESAEDDVPVTWITSPLLGFVLAHAAGREVLFLPWQNINRDIAAACVRAGIVHATPNDLRRTFATWHRQRGLDPHAVSRLLRHTTDKLAQTTYARLQGVELASVINAELGSTPVTNVAENEPSGRVSMVYTENTEHGAADDRAHVANGLISSAPGRTRTCDQRLRRPPLYPSELRARETDVPQRGADAKWSARGS